MNIGASGSVAEVKHRLAGGNKSDRRKWNGYFPDEMIEEWNAEARRQDRTLSWVVQQAWRIAKLKGHDFSLPVKE